MTNTFFVIEVYFFYDQANGHEIGHGKGCHVARPMLAADVARRVLTWI
jgi:hypothetical protein